MEPKWLVWAREIQATAQTGLAYAKDVYDRQRYESLQHLAAVIMAEFSGINTQVVEGLFSEQRGYATPKVEVRGAVFKNEQILLVQERSDGRWALPGGWADVNQSPQECVIAEVRDESGIEVRPVKLAAVYDRAKHAHQPPYAFPYLQDVFYLRDPRRRSRPRCRNLQRRFLRP
jgi:ADP-ribose pyrophosphatase YjhB (NUDIX family)